MIEDKEFYEMLERDIKDQWWKGMGPYNPFKAAKKQAAIARTAFLFMGISFMLLVALLIVGTFSLGWFGLVALLPIGASLYGFQEFYSHYRRYSKLVKMDGKKG